jgi:hypothetical protein
MDTKAMMERQEAIVQEMASVRFMQKGSISQQRVPRRHAGAETGQMRGPYPVLTWKEKGKTRSLRLKTPEEVVWAETAVANHRRFAALCREYEELGEQIARQLRDAQEPAAMEAVKKGLKPRSRRAQKSKG